MVSISSNTQNKVMRNIFVLPTDKPSRVAKHSSSSFHIVENNAHNKGLYNMTNQYIYITNDEAIKEGDWYFNHRIKFIEKRHEPKRTLANISLVNQKLNWTPNVSVYEWIDGQI
jgi:hypothetical protein